jgi:hypothetical protein
MMVMVIIADLLLWLTEPTPYQSSVIAWPGSRLIPDRGPMFGSFGTPRMLVGGAGA